MQYNLRKIDYSFIHVLEILYIIIISNSLMKSKTKSIAFTTVTIISILILILPVNITLNGFSQTRESPGFQPSSTKNIVKEMVMPPEEIAMKVLLEPHKNKYLKDWYQSSNFAFIAGNISQLYELEDGVMAEAFVPGERTLTGIFQFDTGVSKKLMNLSSTWKAVEEERERDGETVQVIEGTLTLGNDSSIPEYQYQINGTLSTNNDNYILEIKDKK